MNCKKAKAIREYLLHVAKLESRVLIFSGVENYTNIFSGFSYVEFFEEIKKSKFDTIVILFYIEKIKDLNAFFAKILEFLDDDSSIVIFYSKKILLKSRIEVSLLENSLKIIDEKIIYNEYNGKTFIGTSKIKKSIAITIKKDQAEGIGLLDLNPTNVTPA